MNLVIIFCDLEFICVNDWFWVYVRWISELLLDKISVYDYVRIWDLKEVWQNLVDHVLEIKTLDK